LRLEGFGSAGPWRRGAPGEAEALLGAPGGERRLRVLGNGLPASQHLDQVVPAGAGREDFPRLPEAQVLGADGGGLAVRLRLSDDPVGEHGHLREQSDDESGVGNRWLHLRPSTAGSW
jgi:hypothetical protein